MNCYICNQPMMDCGLNYKKEHFYYCRGCHQYNNEPPKVLEKKKKKSPVRESGHRLPDNVPMFD